MFERVFTNLYGKMTWTEKLRLFWLSGTLFFIIGGYWLLRSIKDPVIATINGVECIPKASDMCCLCMPLQWGVGGQPVNKCAICSPRRPRCSRSSS